jgi:hypothetical protein
MSDTVHLRVVGYGVVGFGVILLYAHEKFLLEQIGLRCMTVAEGRGYNGWKKKPVILM